MTQVIESQVLSPEEILKKFMIELSPSPDTAELQRINADVANKYQEASVHYTKAKHLHSRVTRQYNATRDELTLQVAQTERKKVKREDRFSSDEKKAEAGRLLNENKVSDQLETAEYYLEVWNTVLRSLKFVSSRIGDAIIEDASEKKMLTAVRNPSTHVTTEEKTSVWRAGPPPEGDIGL